ncbi:MAG: hypothetical protein BET99_03865 [Marine Group III euryarchaeote CG-Epi2]|uniref:Uncharacterized protein n=1 Tax=Marine Group III euryarchaeote CG-Epi2 TaxID=1888996 RepID=A0A1J5TP48_9ARCH|nr:MAG: hypothetical protein BET99_03865 [Marine Group III euryarchaeote CG-Epi2]
MMEEEIELGEALPIPGSLESSDNEVVTNFDILKIIFSRKTAPHAFSLSIFLILLGFFSQSSNQLFINLILILGFGFSWGYLITAFLMRFDYVKNFSVGTYRKILFVPMLLSFLISLILYYIFEYTNYGESVRDALSLILIFIFIVWQFAQAWWMRVPFKEIALKKMVKVNFEDSSNFGKYMNAVSPFFWAIIGFCVFLILESQGVIFSLIFKILWFILLILLGSLTFYLLNRMNSKNWSDPMISTFSGYFAVGYWSFLSYHLAVMLYSRESQPSFVFDLVFMIMTIMLVIYSLSAQTLRSERRKNKASNQKQNIMNRHNVILYAISFTAAYGASSFFLASGGTSFVSNIKNVGFISHLIVIISGILVILLSNYTALVGRGLIDQGFVDSIRTPKDN